LKAALERLGFSPCYHMVEVPRRGHGPYWREAMRRKPIEWEAAFAGYRATVDFPAANFWAELAQAYPKAKVLLSIRDPQRWYDSASKAFSSVPTIDTSTAGGHAVSKVAGLLVPKLWGAMSTMQEMREGSGVTFDSSPEEFGVVGVFGPKLTTFAFFGASRILGMTLLLTSILAALISVILRLRHARGD
jgi:hypothetical protein